MIFATGSSEFISSCIGPASAAAFTDVILISGLSAARV
jgi:hypothetical protein